MNCIHAGRSTGSRKIADELGINRKTAQRHMREMGIAGICPGPNLSKKAAKAGTFPYLLRGLTVTHPNHVWGIDITYIRMLKGWMYLVAVLDWYSRFVVSWELDNSLEETFVLNAVDRALTKAVPTIWNSDQGSLLSEVEGSPVRNTFSDYKLTPSPNVHQ